MKKNKLTFLIAASFLAFSTLAGCNDIAPTPGNSNNGGASDSLVNSDSQGGEANSSDSGTQGSSDNTGGSSQGGGQETKTDWSDAEKNIMKQNLHGLVLPFVEMDVRVSVSQSSGSVKIESTENMASGFLASYKAKFDADQEWVGQDISEEYNVYPGNAFLYQRSVTQNGNKYYVAVMFMGIDYSTAGEPSISKEGRFYLEAMDPYVYEYPAEFINQYMGQMYNTNIFPPSYQAEYYSLDSEGVLFGYSETDIENSYKVSVETSGKFTIDPEKNSEGYYVAHPNDGTYVMYFKYDAANKVMILKVEAPKGWNNAAINAIFNSNNVNPFSLGTIEDPNITFNASEMTSAEVTFLCVDIGRIDVQGVQAYINSLKTLGYKVAIPNVVVDSNQYFTTFNVITNEGMFTGYVTYSTAQNANSLSIQVNLTPNPYVVKSWPAASIARYLDAEQDTVPAFVGDAYGFNFSIQNTYNNVAVIVDNGAEAAARDAYIKTLTVDNGYTASGTLGGQPAYKSPNNEILVAVGCDPTGWPGEINILIDDIVVVSTPWPAADIRTAVNKLYAENPITDTIPVLDVSDASECYVNDNFSTIGEYILEFEIDIDGLAASEAEFKRDFKTAGWTEDVFYGYDTNVSAYGAFISPNKQLVAYFDVVGSDLVIYVKTYHDQHYASWPAQDISTAINKWGVKKDALPSFDSANMLSFNESNSVKKLEVEILVGESLNQTVVDTYSGKLEQMGYRYDETKQGFISNNRELLVKVFIEGYQGVYVVKMTAESIIPVYKVVGIGGNWNYAQSDYTLVDATYQGENYETQLKASFPVAANDEFKVHDGENGWIGAEILENNDKFNKLENGNIQAKEAGTVDLYLKTYSDGSRSIALVFNAAPVVLAPWPSEAINEMLESWNIDDEIPTLQDQSILDIQFTKINDDKFSVTVVGGSDLLERYNRSLAEAFTFFQGAYANADKDLIIDTHNTGNDLVITVSHVEVPVLNPWPEEEILEFFGDDLFDDIPYYEVEGASFSVVNSGSNGDIKFMSIRAEVPDADGYLDDFVSYLTTDKSYAAIPELQYYASTNEGTYPRYSFGSIAEDNKSLVVTLYYFPAEEQPELEPWPEEELVAFFGENTFDAIPEIKIAGASYHVDDTGNVEGYQVFIMTVTVEDAANKMSAAIQELENQFGFVTIDSDGASISSKEGFPIYSFTPIDDNSFSLVIYTVPADEPSYRLVGSMIGWSYDDGIVLQELEAEEGYLAQYGISYYEVDADEEFKVTDGTGDSGWFGYESLADNAYFKTNDDGNIVAKQEGVMALTFSILSDGSKQIVINFVPSEVQDHSWAATKAAMDNELPEGKVVPDLEVEGALAYDYNGSIDITFAEDANMRDMVNAVAAKLEAAGYHLSRRFMGYVNTGTDLCFTLEVNDNVISVYCGENAYEVDGGYGFLVLSYDETDDLYWPIDSAIGDINPSNDHEYMILEYEFSEGTYFIIYDFTNEVQFNVSVDPASLNNGYASYFEYDETTGLYLVKQDFAGAVYIKLSYGNDQIFVGFVQP